MPDEDDAITALGAFDTPTICNALDLLRPDRSGIAFTARQLVWARPDAPPMVGRAVTALVRGDAPPGWDAAEGGRRRHAYWTYLAGAARPSLLVAQDLAPEPGFGGIWGDVNAAIHLALGIVGVVTDGAVRDLPLLPAGFGLLAGTVTPSHGHGHVVEWGVAVSVAGMAVQPGDIVHADRHGAVRFPPDLVATLPEAARRVQRREALILEAARQPGADPDRLVAAFRAAAAI